MLHYITLHSITNVMYEWIGRCLVDGAIDKVATQDFLVGRREFE